MRVKVTPGSRSEQVDETGEHTFDMYVREPAQAGLATGRVRALVARHYGVALGDVKLQTGAQSRQKTFMVRIS